VSLLSAADLEPIARRQLADYDAHRPGTLFSDPEFRLTLPEAYQVQMRVASLRESRGESIAGYKVGCVSESVQKQLGIAEPVFGHLFVGETHRSGVSLDSARFDHLAIEGEFALRIAEDSASIDAAFAVIELHNYVLRAPAAARAVELVAGNAMQAGIVLPPYEPRCSDPNELAAESISVLRNGAILGASTGAALPGGPMASLTWLLTRLKDFGITLQARQIVLTGSPLPLYAVAPGDRIEIRCGRLPPVTMTVNP